MKKLTTSLLAILAGAALLNTSASANSVVGDLMLGFQTASPNTGNDKNLEIDLGQFSLFTTTATIDLSSDFNLNDLVATYGSAPSDLTFGITGTRGNPTTEVFVTSTDGTVPTRHNSQGSVSSLISNIYNAYNSGTPGAAGSKDSIVSSSVAGAYSQVAQADGQYNGNFAFTTEALYSANGTETLALYDVQKGSGLATELGIFTLTTNGSTESLTFTGSAVEAPEPSTYAMLGLGALATFFAFRRRNAFQA